MTNKVSLTSRLLHFLGNRFLVPLEHEGLGLGYDARDFYWRPEDRPLVAVKDEEIRKRLRVNQLRILLFERTAWVASGAAFVVCLAATVGILAFHRVAHVALSFGRASTAEIVAQDLAAGDCKDVFKRYSGKEEELLGDGITTKADLLAFRARCADALKQ